jgi:hypothetical protein
VGVASGTRRSLINNSKLSAPVTTKAVLWLLESVLVEDHPIMCAAAALIGKQTLSGLHQCLTKDSILTFNKTVR